MNWGPWAPGLDEAERRARLRALRVLVRVYCGPAGADAGAALKAAETDLDMMRHAFVEVDRLPAIGLRRALATYAAIHAPGGGR